MRGDQITVRSGFTGPDFGELNAYQVLEICLHMILRYVEESCLRVRRLRALEDATLHCFYMHVTRTAQ